jgi:hypothetical protein
MASAKRARASEYLRASSRAFARAKLASARMRRGVRRRSAQRGRYLGGPSRVRRLLERFLGAHRGGACTVRLAPNSDNGLGDRRANDAQGRLGRPGGLARSIGRIARDVPRGIFEGIGRLRTRVELLSRWFPRATPPRRVRRCDEAGALSSPCRARTVSPHRSDAQVGAYPLCAAGAAGAMLRCPGARW